MSDLILRYIYYIFRINYFNLIKLTNNIFDFIYGHNRLIYFQ